MLAGTRHRGNPTVRIAALIMLVIVPLAAAGCGETAQVAEDPVAVPMIRGEVVLPGATLAYATPPTAAPCIVLGSSVYHERVFSAQFKRSIGCTFVDTRLHAAGAEAPDGGYGVEALLADLDQVRDQLGFERVMVVGHSIFGLMALEYARQYPGRVSHVAMIAAPAWHDESIEDVRERYWIENATSERRAVHDSNLAGLQERLAGLDPAETIRETYIANAALYWADPTYDASWLWDGVAINPGLIEALLDDVARRPRFSAGEPLNVPVFLAFGRYDYVVPPVVWDGEQGALQNLFIEIFPASGHTPPLEEPRAFDGRLTTWLTFAR
jgi:proline iminopeptidase